MRKTKRPNSLCTSAFCHPPKLKVLKDHQRWVWDAVFSADSSYLVTACSDHHPRLWDLRTGDLVRTYQGHNLAVTCVALNDAAS